MRFDKISLLFYTLQSSAMCYSDQPQGICYPERLLEGLPAFGHLEDQGHQKQPKKLVLPDWPFPRENAPNYYKILQDLRSAKFEIYISTNDALIPWDPNVTLPRVSHDAARSTPPYDQMAAQGIARDHALLLNEETFKALFFPFQYDFLQAWGIAQASERTRLIQALAPDFPAVSIWVKDALDLHTWSELHRAAPDLRFYLILTTACLEAMTSHSELESLMNATDSIKLQYNTNYIACPQGLSSKVKILAIDYKSQISATDLRQILMESKEIVELYLSNCKTLEHLDLAGCSFKKLRDLNVSCSNISAEALRQLLQEAEEIEELNVFYCKTLEQLDLAGCSFKKLRTLNVSYSNISAEALRQLLQEAKEIEALNVSNCETLERLDLAGCSFKKLRYLNVSCSNISAEALRPLLQEAEEIVELSLLGCETLAELDLAGCSFKKLRYLDVSYSNISAEALRPLLQEAAAIEELNVSGCQTLLELNLAGCSFKKLRCLGADGSNVSPAAFRHLEHAQAIALARFNNHRISTSISNMDSKRQAPSIQRECNAMQSLEMRPSSSLSATGYFRPLGRAPNISVAQYRLNVYEDIEVRERLAFKCNPRRYVQGSLPLNTATASNINTYEAKVSISCALGTYYPLPSLDPNETISNFSVTGCAPRNIELYREDASQQYYLKANINGPITVNYTLAMSNELPLPFQNKLLRRLVEEYQNYKPGQLAGTTPQQILNNVGENNVGGACRFRAAAFFQNVRALQAVDVLPSDLKVRIITNDVHAYVEIREGMSAWKKVDLGGNLGNIQKHMPWNHCDEQEEKESLPTVRILPIDPNNYCMSILQEASTKKSLLIGCASKEALHCFQRLLLSHLKTSVFHIQDPDHLRLLTQEIKLTEGTSGTRPIQITPKQHAAWLDFLTEARNFPQENYYWTIDWTAFTPKQITQFNTLLDENRTLHRAPIPDNVHLIGFTTHTHYPSPDFYSRHAAYQVLPCENAALQRAVNLLDFPSPPKETDCVCVIDLFNAPDWKAQLCGVFLLTEGGLCFREGPFLRALKAGTQFIEIKNAPTHLKEWQDFWQDLYRTRELSLYGETVSIPEATTLRLTEGYDAIENLTTVHTWHHGVTGETRPEETYIVNPSTFTHCFQNYTIAPNASHNDNEGDLRSLLGHLERHQRPLLVAFYVTRDLSLDAWMRLLKMAEENKVQCTFYLAPGVSLPKPMSQVTRTAPLVSVPTSAENTKNTIFVAEDLEEAAHILYDIYQPSIQLTITDLECTEFLQSIADLKFEDKAVRGRLVTHPVLQALREGQKVLLKGTLSLEQEDLLASLFCKEGYFWTGAQKERLPGQLILVTTKKDTLDFISKRSFKQFCLEKNIPLQSSQISLKHWEETLTDPMLPLDIEHNRLDAISDALKEHPYVLIEGPTGAGKSTLIENYQKQNPGQQFFHEGSSVSRWAETQEGGVLVMDEANLTSFRFPMFEDLRNTPPSLWIDGQYYALKSQHKVVFIGNPMNYGGERQDIALFHQCPKITLKTLPPAYLKEYILEPLLQFIEQPDLRDKVADLFLNIYNTLLRDPEKPAISPRELKMMALMLRASWKETSSISVFKMAQQITQTISEFLKGSVPIGNHTERSAVPQKLGEDFCLTHAHQANYALLQALLKVRTLRQSTPDPNLDTGINAVCIEGPSGIGKSAFVTHLLEPYKAQVIEIPAHADLEAKEGLLLQAFREGKIAVIHEFNSTFIPEKLINSLLMGRDLENNPPLNPGFMLLTTQNPISFAGRTPVSLALDRRFLRCVLPLYTSLELMQIASTQFPNLNKDVIEREVNEYQKRLAKAMRDPARIPGTLRDLLRTLEAMPVLQQESEATHLFSEQLKLKSPFIFNNNHFCFYSNLITAIETVVQRDNPTSFNWKSLFNV